MFAARTSKPGGGLYIHIPFCRSLCAYCNFVHTDRHDAGRRRQLADAVIGEFRLRRRACAVLAEGRRPLQSVYIGGGTPSVLEPAQMTRLLAETAGRLPAAPGMEMTAEANPESLTAATARAWVDAGINRVSLGVQSLDDRVLAQLGRACDATTARAALARACRHFPRVAADWIIGPGVQSTRLSAELAEAIAMGVEHVSLYILELHASTPLSIAVARGEVDMPTDRQIERVYLTAVARLEQLGLRQYEVASFARTGCESLHNRHYWSRVPYLGLGPGAHGFYGRMRYANHADPAVYGAAVADGELPEARRDPLSRDARRLEALFLPLRTDLGVSLADIPPKALPLARGERSGWWRRQGGRLRLTPKGFLRIDAIEAALARGLRSAGSRPGAAG